MRVKCVHSKASGLAAIGDLTTGGLQPFSTAVSSVAGLPNANLLFVDIAQDYVGAFPSCHHALEKPSRAGWLDVGIEFDSLAHSVRPLRAPCVPCARCQSHRGTSACVHSPETWHQHWRATRSHRTLDNQLLLAWLMVVPPGKRHRTGGALVPASDASGKARGNK